MAGSQAFNKLQKERPRKEKQEERQLGDWNADVKSRFPDGDTAQNPKASDANKDSESVDR